ncbi:hypothetical protein ACO2Q3_12980 [Caulobacter sp. KR2-114]|uniref:hypothetical protein n=1 Tax=Caulobacter sp. KR2-114 TaxID=3400912 RepID=UPI003C074C77
MASRTLVASAAAALVLAAGAGLAASTIPWLASRPSPDTAAARAAECATVADIAAHPPFGPLAPDTVISPYLVGGADRTEEPQRVEVHAADRWRLGWLLARSRANAQRPRPDLDCRNAFLAAGLRLDPGVAERTRLAIQGHAASVISYSRADRFLNTALVTEVAKSCRYLPVLHQGEPKHVLQEGGARDATNLALAHSHGRWRALGGFDEIAILRFTWLDACPAAPSPQSPVLVESPARP